MEPKTNNKGPITENMFKKFIDLTLEDIQKWDTAKTTTLCTYYR